MGYDLRNAALIACCVLAIVVAAPLFPAAGYGDYPDRDAVDSGYYGDGSSDGILPLEIPNIDPGAFEFGTGEPDDDGPDDEPDDEPEEPESDDDAVSGGEFELSAGALAAVLVVSILGMIGLSWRVTDPARSRTYDTGDLPTGFIPNITFRLRRIPQLTMAATIAASRAVPALADAAFRTGRDVGAGVGAITRGVGRGIGATLLAVPAVLGAFARRASAPRSIRGGVTSLLTSIRERGGSRAPKRSLERTVATDGAAIEEPEFGPKSVEEAWEEMVEAVAGRRNPATTPGEYATKAVDAGLPAGPVSTLTDAFREIRYGGYPPSPERTQRARVAAERLERNHDEDGGEPT